MRRCQKKNLPRCARMKVSPAFSKAAGCRGGAPARAPQRAELSCAHTHKRSGRGSKGETLSRGFPLFLYASACAPFYWEVVATPCCHSTPFLWCLPKETVSSRQRKALFYPGGSTIRVSAAASVVFTHLRPTWGGAWRLTGRSSQLDAVGGDVGASSSWERRAGPNSSRGGTHKRVSLGLHPVSLRKSKEMGWNGQGRRGLLPNKTAHTCPAPRRSIFSHHPSTQRCSPSPVTALVRLRPSGVNSLLTVCRLKCIIILMICVLEGAFE